MITLLLVWLFLLVLLIIFVVGRPREGGVLPLAYFLGLSIIHVPGVLSYLDRSPRPGHGEPTQIGFELTLLGMAAFIAGALLGRLWVGRQARPQAAPVAQAQGLQAQGLRQVAWRVFVAGAISYFVLMPLVSLIPSLTSVMASVATLLVLGIWLQLYEAAATKNWRRTVAMLLVIALLPFTTIVSSGFIGFGAMWAVCAISFLYVISGRRILSHLLAPVVVFLGLSLFVTYMGQRDAIRDALWYRQSNLTEQMNRISKLATEFEFFNIDSPRHAGSLDTRLNQNYLVGVGVMRQQAGLTELVYGATVPWWALIPRAVWPDKPAVGGGGTLVSSFTGIHFDRSTSVGIGQVLEFYINFGWAGVLLGFTGLGFLFMRLDRGIMRALGSGDMRKFFLYGMPGLMMMQPGGNLLEIAVGAASAIVAAEILFHFRLFDASEWRLDSKRSLRLPSSVRAISRR